jgi:folate-binding protein YgfZ
MADDYQHACQDAALFDLSGRGLVELVGKDAVSFLHNLSTNDIKALAPGTSCEAFLCTAKARVVAHVFVNRLQLAGGQTLWLDMVPGLVEKVLRHLGHYLISEEVEVGDHSPEVTQLYLCGPQAPRILDKALAGPIRELKELQFAVGPLGKGGLATLRRHDYLVLPGYDIFCDRRRQAEVQQLLISAGATPASHETYDVLRVEAGFPEYGRDIDEDRFVVEVGRTRQAICYSKGCYLGQEPIVMARDRGHVNRTLLGLKIREGGPVPAGTRVRRGAEEVGHITSAVWSPRVGSAIGLAYLRRGSQEPGTQVEVEGEAGHRPAEVAALPFVHSGGAEAGS